MPTGRESSCWHEITKEKLRADENGLQCITDHEDFKVVCLNSAVILTAVYQFIEHETYIDDTPTFE